MLVYCFYRTGIHYVCLFWSCHISNQNVDVFGLGNLTFVNDQEDSLATEECLQQYWTVSRLQDFEVCVGGRPRSEILQQAWSWSLFWVPVWRSASRLLSCAHAMQRDVLVLSGVFPCENWCYWSCYRDCRIHFLAVIHFLDSCWIHW